MFVVLIITEVNRQLIFYQNNIGIMTTNFKKVIAIFAGSLMFMASCSDIDDSFYGNEEGMIALKCSRSADWTLRNVAVDTDGKGSFEAGDRIEMNISTAGTTSNTTLQYSGSQWMPALKRSEYGTGELLLSAVYPILPQAAVGENIRTISIPADQSTTDNHNATDILFARTTVKEGSVAADMQFAHAMHRIKINLKGSIPEDLTVEIKSLRQGTMSVADGSVSPDEAAGYIWIKPYKTGDSSYSVIIMPQDAKAFHDGEGLISFKSGGKSAKYMLKSDISTFEAGKQTTLNLTLKMDEGGVDTEFANQTRWVYGVKGVDFPGRENITTYPVGQTKFPAGEWLRFAYEDMYPPQSSEMQFLTWKEGCGWYDCNKTFQYIGDGNMCWAATASNLIHWWLEQNKKYIDAYDKTFGPEYSDITRPSEYHNMTADNQQHSAVFNFFKKSFANKGSWETGGVNWFINGNFRNLNPLNPNFHGFFGKVFSKDDDVAKETKDMTKENFNACIKKAFKNNNAIGFSAYDFAGTGTGVHAMTIWGVEFDENGDVAFIYFCDNNMAEMAPNNGAVQRYKIVYDKSTIPELKGLYTYMIALPDNGNINAKKIPFSSLTLVDLRIDIWEKAPINIK